jgi:hypothetical protein
MENKGLAETVKTTTNAPTMYEEVEQEENVPRGYVKVMEVIAYDPVGKKTNDVGKETVIEKGRQPYFCQNSEDIITFKENNPKARIETFAVQLLKQVAIRKINDHENMKQFGRGI